MARQTRTTAGRCILDRWREHSEVCVRIRPNYALGHSDLGIFALWVEGDLEKARQLRAELLSQEGRMPTDLVHAPLPQELRRAKRAFATQVDGEMALA